MLTYIDRGMLQNSSGSAGVDDAEAASPSYALLSRNVASNPQQPLRQVGREKYERQSSSDN